MKRRNFIKNLALGSALSLFSPLTVKTKKAKKKQPNILFFLADDLGWGDLSIYNRDKTYYRYTPNIDLIFKKGIQLTNFMCHCVCSPTRAGLLTGKHFAKIRSGPLTSGTIPVKRPNLAKDLKKNNYITGAFGKWHNGFPPMPDNKKGQIFKWRERKKDPLHGETCDLKNGIFDNHKNIPWGPGVNAYGFDQWVGFYSGGEDYFDRYDVWAHDINWFHNKIYRPDETGYTTELLCQHALKFIEKSKKRPFLCYMPFSAVHGPYHVLKKDLMELCSHFPGEWNYVKNIKSPSTGRKIKEVEELRCSKKEEFDYKKIDPNRKHFQRLIYAALIYSLDKAVGRMLQKIVKEGLQENTIIIFSSDNGANPNGINKPFRGGKHTLWDGGIHVPTAIWRPGVLDADIPSYTPEKNKYTGYMGYLDIYPTLMAMAGLSPSAKDLDGINCLPYIKANKECRPDLSDAMFWMWDEYGVVRTKKWKLRYSENDQAKRCELYDIRSDIWEENDIQSKHPDVRDTLIFMYKKWIKTNNYTTSYLPIHADNITHPNPAPSGQVIEVQAWQNRKISKSEPNGLSIRFATAKLKNYGNYIDTTDRMEFDIFVCKDSEKTKGFYYSPSFRWDPVYNLKNGVDQDGVLLATHALPKGKWIRKVIGVGNICPSPTTVNHIVLRDSTPGYYHFYIDNVVVRKGDGTIRVVIWKSKQDFEPILYRYDEVNYQSFNKAKKNKKFPFEKLIIRTVTWQD